MKVAIQDGRFDTILLPTEWRYSAAIVGLLYYFEFQNKEYEPISYKKVNYEGWPGIAYSSEDISEERFLSFAEDFYSDEFFHVKAKKMLEKESWTDEEISTINGFLTGNKVLKDTFGKNKFNGENVKDLLSLLETNRLKIIKETFRFKLNLYRKFCNTNLLFTEENPHCRLLGYIVDENRKSKETSFMFDAKKVSTTDIKEFDFIPFAFTNTADGFFINNNYDIHALFNTAKHLKNLLENEKEEKETAKMTLLRNLVESSGFLNYDVEIILKNQDKEYFETLFLRKSARNSFIDIQNVKPYHFRYKIGENYRINVEEELFYRCMNQVVLDDLIEQLLKIRMQEDLSYLDYLVFKLVELNIKWKDELMDKGTMNEKIKNARRAGYFTAQALKRNKAENKIASYRQKLTSAVIFHDYDRVNEILLQLEGYAGMDYSFIYDLFEDGEKNKDIAFAFISALNVNVPAE